MSVFNKYCYSWSRLHSPESLTMNILQNVYQKSLVENERNIQYWENYIVKLKKIDFNVYTNDLKLSGLVPIGSRISFRGEIVHTNEVMVSIGDNYFVKCSVNQAEELKGVRIKDAESKLSVFKKEREYLEKQITFNKESVFTGKELEIIEDYNEEEDKVWREKHKEIMREYRNQCKRREQSREIDTQTDAELWSRLEELELKEELEGELEKDFEKVNIKDKKSIADRPILVEAGSGDTLEYFKSNEEIAQSIVKKENETKEILNNILLLTAEYVNRDKAAAAAAAEAAAREKAAAAATATEVTNEMSKSNVESQQQSDVDDAQNVSSKLDLLQKVLDKQNNLESKLNELKNKERNQSKTEEDLISKLDEMEKIDELEDEIDRIDGVIHDDLEQISDEDTKNNDKKLKKSVCFADEDDSETLEITFKHSNFSVKKIPYDAEKGIVKPSDIYEVYSNLFNVTKSTLKKTKHNKAHNTTTKLSQENNRDNKTDSIRSIVVKDVAEKCVGKLATLENGARPTSLFKKRRMQKNASKKS